MANPVECALAFGGGEGRAEALGGDTVLASAARQIVAGDHWEVLARLGPRVLGDQARVTGRGRPHVGALLD